MTPWIPRHCDWCGAEITAQDSYILYGHRFFCSQKCYLEWQNANARMDDEGMAYHQGDIGDFGGAVHRDFDGDDAMAHRRFDHHEIED